MAVYNAPTLLSKEALKFFLIFNHVLVGRNFENSASERFNLFAWNKRGIDKKVKLHFASINMAIVVHDNRFDAATNHFADDLCNPNRFSHLASTASGQDLNHRKGNNL